MTQSVPDPRSGPSGRPVGADAPATEGATAALSPETTIELLGRAQAGDSAARDRLISRCLPALTRWAHGRLPALARGAEDTADLVQTTVLKTFQRLDHFEARHEGALQAYLRQALANQIRDILRSRRHKPVSTDLPQDLPDPGESPLERILGQEQIDRYEDALQRLKPHDRQAIIARIELQYDYEELAVALDKPTAEAARQAVRRALVHLAEEMRRGV